MFAARNMRMLKMYNTSSAERLGLNMLDRLALILVVVGALNWGGIGLFLVGLWLVAAAFVPRLKPYLGLSSPAAIWVRRVDLARHATATAKTLPGVLSASTLVTKKKITVTATSATVDETVRERLPGQLQESLGPLINDRLSLQVLLREDEDGGRF